MSFWFEPNLTQHDMKIESLKKNSCNHHHHHVAFIFYGKALYKHWKYYGWLSCSTLYLWYDPITDNLWGVGFLARFFFVPIRFVTLVIYMCVCMYVCIWIIGPCSMFANRDVHSSMLSHHRPQKTVYILYYVYNQLWLVGS